MRRMRKQPVGAMWDAARWHGSTIEVDVGDRVWTDTNNISPGGDHIYNMHDLYASNGWNKSAAGDLTPRLVKKNGKPREAIQKDGVFYWMN